MDIEKVLGIPELLAQLAEECSELSQAALKLRRAVDGKNPTPKPITECIADMDEEIADVQLCIKLLGFHSNAHVNVQADIMTQKKERWLKRLKSNVDIDRRDDNG